MIEDIAAIIRTHHVHGIWCYECRANVGIASEHQAKLIVEFLNSERVVQ